MPEIRVQLEEDDYVEAGQAAARKRIEVALYMNEIIFLIAWLALIVACAVRMEIAFQPAGFSVNPFAKSAIAEDLMVRVDEARSKRA